MAELEETLNNGMEDVKLDICDAVPEVKKHFLGVRRIKNKWQARVRHPKLRFEISLGTYSSAEEAALAVKKKKAEYAEIFKIGETSGDDFGERKLPSGVCRRGYGRWGARLWHPGLKKHVSLGCFNSPEEAAAVLDNKKAEYLELYGSRSKHKVLDKYKREVPKVPAGVRKLKSGRFGARFRDPESGARISLGTFGTFEEAVRSIERKKAMVNGERKRAELNGCEASDEGAVKRECEFDHGLIDQSDFDEAERKWAELNIYEPNGGTIKRENEFGRGCLLNSNEAGLIGVGDQQRTSSAYDFDEAVKSGFMNEYGVLLGMYSEVDRQMEFSLTE